MKYVFLFFIVVLFVSCEFRCNPIISNQEVSREVVRKIIKDAKNCALITVDSEGNAYARTMDPFLPKEDFTIWMATNPLSIKVQEIQRNPKTTLYYFDAKSVSYVTLLGTSKIVDSKKEKEKYWKKEWKNFYKNRTTDYLLIRFTPKSATVVSEKYNIIGDSITWEAPHLRF